MVGISDKSMQLFVHPYYQFLTSYKRYLTHVCVHRRVNGALPFLSVLPRGDSKLQLDRVEGTADIKNVLTWTTTVQFNSHRNVRLPFLGVESDKAGSNVWNKTVINNSLSIVVALE